MRLGPHERAGWQRVSRCPATALALAWAARCPPPILLAERHCGCGRDHPFPDGGGVCLHPRFRAAVVGQAATQPVACPGLPPAAKEAWLPGLLRLRGVVAGVPYRKKLAAVGPGRLRFPLFPAPFFGASSARSSICASLACNIPRALRATYAVTNVPNLLGHGLDLSCGKTRIFAYAERPGIRPIFSRPEADWAWSRTMSRWPSRAKFRARNTSVFPASAKAVSGCLRRFGLEKKMTSCM